jgi:flagellin
MFWIVSKPTRRKQDHTMALTVRTNVASMLAAGALSRTSNALTQSLGRVSSGLRINSASDDAAGLGVATNLETGVISTRQAMRNTNDGISIVQTAEGAANEVTDILQRLRELAVQSSSETLSDDERAFIDDEAGQLIQEIQRIADVTEFNGISLSNTVSTLDVQVGTTSAATARISIVLGDLSITTGLAVDGVDLSTTAGAQAALDTIDTALGSVNSLRSTLGAVQNRLESSLANSQTYVEALSSAQSQVLDLDFATETAELTKLQIMQQAGVASLAQAKTINQSVISLLS